MPPFMREPSRDNSSTGQYIFSRGEENRPPVMQPTDAKVNAMDVTLSIGFLSGIVGQESSKNSSRDKMYDSSGAYNQDGVRVMVTALVPAKALKGFENIVSAPIEAAEDVGRKKVYSAIFPLKGGKVTSSITIPSLLQEVQTSGRHMRYGQQCFKPQAIDLLISLVYQNEQLCFGKTTILATGEDVRTKQVDLPIDTARDSITRAQKKSTSGKKLPSMTADRHGDVAATAFKYDRSRRKYKIEKAALLRVFIKAKPADTRPNRSQSQPSRSSSTRHLQQKMSNMRSSYPHQPMDTRGMRGHTPMDSSSASRRSRSQSRDDPSSSRHTGSRRSRSGYSENDYPGVAPTPIQRPSRSSSRSRSHNGIPLTIEPQVNPGYRSKSAGSQRNIPPQTQRNHASSYGGRGVYPESVAPNSIYPKSVAPSVRSGYSRNDQSSRMGFPKSVAPSVRSRYIRNERSSRTPPLQSVAPSVRSGYIRNERSSRTLPPQSVAPSVRTRYSRNEHSSRMSPPKSVAPSVRSGYSRNERSSRTGPPLQIGYEGGVASSVYGTSSYQNTRPGVVPQRARSVPRVRTHTPENLNASQSSRSRNQYQTYDPQSVYVGGGGGSQYGAPRYVGDNRSIQNSSSYRHGNTSRDPSYSPSQSVSRHSVRSRSQSHSRSRPYTSDARY